MNKSQKFIEEKLLPWLKDRNMDLCRRVNAYPEHHTELRNRQRECDRIYDYVKNSKEEWAE